MGSKLIGKFMLYLLVLLVSHPWCFLRSYHCFASSFSTSCRSCSLAHGELAFDLRKLSHLQLGAPNRFLGCPIIKCAMISPFINDGLINYLVAAAITATTTMTNKDQDRNILVFRWALSPASPEMQNDPWHTGFYSITSGEKREPTREHFTVPKGATGDWSHVESSEERGRRLYLVPRTTYNAHTCAN